MKVITLLASLISLSSIASQSTLTRVKQLEGSYSLSSGDESCPIQLDIHVDNHQVTTSVDHTGILIRDIEESHYQVSLNQELLEKSCYRAQLSTDKLKLTETKGIGSMTLPCGSFSRLVREFKYFQKHKKLKYYLGDQQTQESMICYYLKQ
ncbi:hypothetical protein HBN50_03455 [Halobacteriovorax sp. GB3]|uniref:hypothetical protein n=1 Tax=Halobacteriovorax sp. GB3 TaxID=2719615 RepID=UPI0023601B86|nr:hypothetical protein [Halobacteriovorax sp. GB3]MDD0852134.1 hypothetical protein [Halobacteriovorax sp. GB3]